MFGKPIRLFRIFGFTVSLDLSWLILLFLVTWSLALGLFPIRFPGLSAGTYWSMGLAGALGLFVSILIHEISHSLVARRFGLRIRGITLFLLGGMAEMPKEPGHPKAEFWMAIAGPLTSAALAALFYACFQLGAGIGMPVFWYAILGYLAIVNVLLAVFNMIPAFPLDGGRVLRSIIWGATGDFSRSTRIAAMVGSGFGILLLVLGIVRVIAGDVVGGLWYMLVGLFIRAGAAASVRQTAISSFLAHERIRDFMNPHPLTVPLDLSVRRLVEDYLYKYDHHAFPVTQGERLAGCVGLAQVRDLPREMWDARKVSDLMLPCPAESTIPPDAEADAALRRMQETGQPLLLVLEDNRLLGIVTAKDLLHYLTLKMELEKRPVGTPLPA